MNIGSLVYCTEQGLGRLAKDFYDHGLITHPVLIPHSRTNHWEWYPANTPQWSITRYLNQDIKNWLQGLDAVLCFETPFIWNVFTFAQQMGIKTFLMPMYECTPTTLPVEPDYYLCPSLLDACCFQPKKSRHLLVPIPDNIPYRQRTECKVFVHNAGNLGLRNRNGTGELLDAIPHITKPIHLIIRSQKPLPWGIPKNPLVHLDLRIGTVPFEELYLEGDVFIFPEKFNGLSLPLQEAKASGMMVMATDRFPNNTYLDQEWLIPCSGYTRQRISPRMLEFDEAIVNPKDIAAKIDQATTMDPAPRSIQALEFRKAYSWEVLKPKYLERLKGW